MTATLIIACQGVWDDGKLPCRGSFSAHTVYADETRARAAAAGWQVGDVDLCPAHARKARS